MSMRVARVLAGLMVLGASTALAQRPIDERRPAAREGTVKISNAVGSVRITGWSKDTIAIAGTIAEGAEIDFQVGGRETSIRVTAPTSSSLQPVDPSAIEVRVPRQSSVAVRTVEASIQVSGVQGSADVESQTGDVRVSGPIRTVYAESAGGDVDLDVSTKVARAKTVDGDITVREARGYLDVSTVSGTLQVFGLEVWETELTSVSGDISFEGSLSREGSLYVESHSGTIDLALDPNQRADFDVLSVAGAIENSLSDATGRTFSVGGGGTQVKIKSFKGVVKIRQLRNRG